MMRVDAKEIQVLTVVLICCMAAVCLYFLLRNPYRCPCFDMSFPVSRGEMPDENGMLEQLDRFLMSGGCEILARHQMAAQAWYRASLYEAHSRLRQQQLERTCDRAELFRFSFFESPAAPEGDRAVQSSVSRGAVLRMSWEQILMREDALHREGRMKNPL